LHGEGLNYALGVSAVDNTFHRETAEADVNYHAPYCKYELQVDRQQPFSRLRNSHGEVLHVISA
jgi:hypothetical protein